MKNGSTPDGMGQTLRLGPQNLGFMFSIDMYRPSNDHRIIGYPSLTQTRMEIPVTIYG